MPRGQRASRGGFSPDIGIGIGRMSLLSGATAGEELAENNTWGEFATTGDNPRTWQEMETAGVFERQWDELV